MTTATIPRMNQLPTNPTLSEALELYELLDAHAWKVLEPFYWETRKRLPVDRMWRYGTGFVRETAKSFFDVFNRHGSLKDSSFLEIGCGDRHPYAVSAILYLNGAARCWATDMSAISDPERSAVAMYDLLTCCLAHPEQWHWSSIERSEFLQRIYQFNLGELRDGHLAPGVEGVPLYHFRGDVAAIRRDLPPIDFIASRAVLEHFLDFRGAMEELLTVLSAKGVAYHAIDFVDHRAYRDSGTYHWWSFLEEGNRSPDGECNRLRISEMIRAMEDVGYEVDILKSARETPPADVLAKIREMCPDLSQEDIETVRCRLTTRKRTET